MRKVFKVTKTGNILLEIGENYYWLLVKENNKIKKTPFKEYLWVERLYESGSEDFQRISLDDAEYLELAEKVAKFEASLPQNVSHTQTPFAELLLRIA